MLPKKFDLDQYKRILLRRKWHAVIPFCVILMASGIYALTAPKLYKASTLILVQRQKVPENYIKSTVTTSLQDRINTLREQVASRTNLEGLITRFDLYASNKPSGPGVIMESKVALMRRRVIIEVVRNAAFSIAFIDQDPYKTRDVANALASNFIEEHLRVREEQSIGTTNFLENELTLIERVLREKEAALTNYTQQYMGALPDQLQTNLALLGQIRKQSESIERSMDEARSQKIMLQGQITDIERMAGSSPQNQVFELGPRDEMAVAPEIQELKSSLKNLRLRYTENHPDILKLKEMIAKMEEETPANEDQAPSEYDTSLGEDNFFDVQSETIKVQLASIDLTIKDLQTQKAKLESEGRRLDKVIADTPKRQLDLISLQRDYEIIKNQYDSLLAKKLQSQLAANMEKRQKGEQFKVIDPAQVPENPIKPNTTMIMLLAVIAGAATGAGLAVGMEYLDESFRDYSEIPDVLQIPLLAVIPRLETADDKRKQRRLRVVAYCLSGCLLMAVGIGVWLWMNGNLQEWVEKIRTAL